MIHLTYVGVNTPQALRNFTQEQIGGRQWNDSLGEEEVKRVGRVMTQTHDSRRPCTALTISLVK